MCLFRVRVLLVTCTFRFTLPVPAGNLNPSSLLCPPTPHPPHKYSKSAIPCSRPLTMSVSLGANREGRGGMGNIGGVQRTRHHWHQEPAAHVSEGPVSCTSWRCALGRETNGVRGVAMTREKPSTTKALHQYTVWPVFPLACFDSLGLPFDSYHGAVNLSTPHN